MGKLAEGRTGRDCLDRPEREFPAPDVQAARVLVTGSSGSIGTRVCVRLRELGAEVHAFDLDDGLDVTNLHLCEYIFRQFEPTHVVHLAAHKYATTGEEDPYEVSDLNVRGTHFVCERGLEHGVENVIVASTCKAIEPETVYGSSKLIAERIALNHGYTVGRFFNVIDSVGNVFEIWRERMREQLPLEVTPCQRYFITGEEAVSYMIHLLGQPAGRRYAPFPGEPVLMMDMVRRFAGPDYPVVEIPPRRGDRLIEPLHGHHERYELIDGRLMVIANCHDEHQGAAAGLTAAGAPGLR